MIGLGIILFLAWVVAPLAMLWLFTQDWPDEARPPTPPDRRSVVQFGSHRPTRPPLDMEHVIVERLATMGTEHGAMLAFELERGRRRRGTSPDDTEGC